MSARRWRRTLAAAGLLLIALNAAADSGAPSLSLPAAIRAALAGNPELRNFAYAFKIQDGQAAQAALRPNPQLDFQAEDFLGTGQSRGFTGAEFSLSLSQTLELGDKRRRRIEVASEERRIIEAERQIRQLDVIADVARRYIAVVADQEQLALAGRAVQLAIATRDEVQKRVDAARSPLAEASRAGIQLARARLDEAEAQRRLATDRQRLASLWGDRDAAFGPVGAALYQLPPVAAFEALRSRLEGNPDLGRYLSEARLRDAEVRLALAAGVQNLTLEAGVRRTQQGSDEALLFGATLPLGVNDRNAGNVASARAARERVDGERAALALRLNSELYGLYQELAQARAEVEGLEREILPRAHEALKQAEYAYQRGRYGYLEWVDVQRELLAVEARHIDAAERFHLSLNEIERLTGEALPQTVAAAADGAPP
jgi:cobalt-zinc-cadmium efflux system outer membrane protein